MYPLKKKTIKHLLNRSVEIFSYCPALSMVDGHPVTYGQMGKQVQTLSRILHKRGILAGDKVAILSENRPNWGIAYFAITTMKAVAVPILPDFHASEVHHILRHSGAKAIFISEKQYPKLEEFRSDTLGTVFIIDDLSVISPDTTLEKLKEVLKDGKREFDKLKQAALKMTGRISDEVEEDDTATIIYTSGTTGHSKGVVLTHKNLVSNTISGSKVQKITNDDRFLSILPLSHSYECTVGFLLPVMQGSAVYYLDKPPVASVLLPAMQKIKPTMMLSVPLIMEKIYKLRILPNFTRSALMRRLYRVPGIRKKLHKIAAGKIYKMFGGSLHFFGIGGALLSPDVERFLRDGGFPYAIGYGLTETSPLIAGCGPALTKFRSTGPAVSGVEIRIDQSDSETGEGEILVRGDNVMKGYYRDKERTDEVFTADGWFRTGDLGILDEDGYLFIKGRKKNMIVGPSGENIYPEEIESVINRSDLVLESVVYKDHDQLTARVHLNYDELDKEFSKQKLSESQIAQSVQEKLEGLRQMVNANVSSFSRIKRIIEQAEPFEKTPTKKIKRYLYTQ